MHLKNYLRLLCLCVLSVAFMSWTIHEIEVVSNSKKTSVRADKIADARTIMYDSLELEEKGLSYNAFEYAITGFERLEKEGVLKNDSILTIIDFDQPSYKKRMFILDMKNFKLLFNTLVAHGKNTGKEIAEFFSNTNQSYKSSLGFYITDETYYGSKGYSLKLKGLEQGVNSNAFRRAIVIHGAPYVSNSYINSQGYIGRSHGCPAVPMEFTAPIIQTIKNGSCLFIYNKSYSPTIQFRVG